MTTQWLSRLLLSAAVLAFVAPSAEAQFGSKKSDKADSAATDKKTDGDKTDKDSAGKTDEKDAKSTAKKPVDKDAPADEEKSGFGSKGKAKPKSVKDEKTTKGPLSDEDKFREKVTKDIEKKLKKKDGFYVFSTFERVFVKTGGGDDGPVRYVPNDSYEARVLEGKETTLKFLVDFMSEYPPVTKKPKKGDPVASPNPVRQWELVKWYKQDDSKDAHNHREQVQAAHDKRVADAAEKARLYQE